MLRSPSSGPLPGGAASGERRRGGLSSGPPVLTGAQALGRWVRLPGPAWLRRAVGGSPAFRSAREASPDEAGGGCVWSAPSGPVTGPCRPQKGTGSRKEEPADRAASAPGGCATTARGPAVPGSPLRLRNRRPLTPALRVPATPAARPQACAPRSPSEPSPRRSSGLGLKPQSLRAPRVPVLALC